MIPNTQLKLLAKKYGTPLYVYDAQMIKRQFKLLESVIKYNPHRIYYAIKANSNLHILKLLKKLGVGADAASPAEVYLAQKAGFEPSDISVTGPNLSKEELAYILNKKIVINADSLSQLENMGKFYTKSQARKLSACAGIRINSMVGAGHHKKVTTGGRDSIFGIHYKDVGGVKKIAQKYNLKIVGLHQHIGSGILKVQDYLRASDVLLQLTEQFDELQYIDFGGGLGVPYESSQKPLNIKELGAKLSEKFTYFAKEKKIELRLEPGRFLVAQAGTLLIEVTALKKTPAGEFVAGTNSGMTHLIRPALYGSYHEVVNISNSEGRRAKTTVKGNVCETSDIFAKNRLISQPREGDLLAIRDTGAYGMAMASRFNGRLLPAEILIDKDAERIIRRRDTFGDFLPK